MDQDSIIFSRACVNHPDLSVTVARTPIGTYRMTFRDDDAGAIIETRIFNSADRANECARMLIDQP